MQINANVDTIQVMLLRSRSKRVGRKNNEEIRIETTKNLHGYNPQYFVKQIISSNLFSYLTYKIAESKKSNHNRNEDAKTESFIAT